MASIRKVGNLSYDPNGAHVTSLETEWGDLFYLSSASDFGELAAIRGGVPIIAPWFATFLGDLQHGWARRSAWTIEETADGFHAELAKEGLSLGVDAVARANGMNIRLSIENTTAESRRIQLGFHPYFRVSDVEGIVVRGLEGVDVVDRVSGETFPAEGDLSFDGLVDVIALGAPEVRIIDRDRVITVRSNGGDSTVVWNPGEKKADSMGDIGVHEWNDFVCVEPALLGARQEGVQLTPGEINILEMDVTVEAAG